MKTLIVYDSFFGNTETIANKIKEAFPKTDVEIKNVKEADFDDLLDIDLLIIGSPTRAFNPSPNINQFTKTIPNRLLKNLKVMTFDTRVNSEDIESRFLRRMINKFGYAAEKLAKKLEKKGATIITTPKGFYVNDKEGPLKELESQKAYEWAKKALA